VLRWPAYGLLFGYFLRAATRRHWVGQEHVVLHCGNLPALLGATLSGDTSWNSTLLLAAQLFAYAMTMGVLADRSVLAGHGYRPARLVDMHNLWSASSKRCSPRTRGWSKQFSTGATGLMKNLSYLSVCGRSSRSRRAGSAALRNDSAARAG
jgi:hypothetical protein